MSSLLSGPSAYALLMLFGLGLPIQAAVGGLVGLGRKIPAGAALFAPFVLFLAGLIGTIVDVEAAIGGLAQASDPAWAPWFAIDDRARSLAPAALGGLGAAVLTLPVVMGAAWTAVRTPQPAQPRLRVLRSVALLAAIAGGGGVGGLGVLAAALLPGALLLLVPAIGGLPFVFFGAIACRARAPSRFAGVVSGYGALLLGTAGLSLFALGLAVAGSAEALGDYAAPFAAIGAVVDATRHARDVALGAVLLALLFAGAGALPFLVREWRRLDATAGMDLLASCSLGLLVLLAGGWAVARERVLTHLAGSHAAGVLTESAGYDVPSREPIPARVLAGDAATPHWLMMREWGGLERLPLAGGLDIAGPAVLRADGLMLAPNVTLEDFYLALFESEAGSISVVGCANAPPTLVEDLRWDPLLAVGRCSAFPLTMRVTRRLEDPRVLIVLKDQLVDDGGDIVPVAEIKNVTGRDVIVRGQLDATVADLVATLRVLGDAGTVYLGHGVTLDGDDVPIGVDPGLRISKLPQEREGDGGQPAADVPAATPAEPASGRPPG